MFKTLLFSALTLSSISAFGQIDDVINKKEAQAKDPSAQSMFLQLYKIFNKVEITHLVDEMKRDGISERKFYARLNLEGQVYQVELEDFKDQYRRILPFSLSIAQDKTVLFQISALGFTDFFDSQDVELAPSKANVFTIRIDDGLSFKDIKTVSWRALDLDLKIPLKKISRTRYIAFSVGGDIGGTREEIKIAENEIIKLGNEISSDLHGYTGPALAGRAGLELREEVGYGILQINANSEYRVINGGIEVLKKDVEHRQLYLKPGVSYSIPLSKNNKSAVSLGFNANIGLIDELKGKDYRIDLSDRNRTPYNLSLKINF